MLNIINNYPRYAIRRNKKGNSQAIRLDNVKIKDIFNMLPFWSWSKTKKHNDFYLNVTNFVSTPSSQFQIENVSSFLIFMFQDLI